MLADKLQKAFNSQLNSEMYSTYLYLSMRTYFESANLAGFANWMAIQTQEEIAHAMQFYDYIIERGGQVVLEVIDAPPHEWDSPLAVFEAVYAHEQKVTGLINSLVDLAIEQNDHAANNFLQWFVNEQVEEESSANAIVQKLKLVDGSSGALFMIDNELAQRVFTPPGAESGGK